MQLDGLTYLRDRKNILAFSAGVDSTALFFLLLDLHIDFDIIMVDYHTRLQSSLEVKYAKELCKRYSKSFFLLDSPDISRDFENTARQIRYKFFDSVIVENGYENLILAHQLNDRLEWFLMQLLRGGSLSSILGFSCMEKRLVKEYSYQIIRPLWEISRDEILAFLKKEQIDFFIDDSNDDEKFFRNRIRKNYANSLIKENLQGIIKSFRYLRGEHKRLYGTREMHWLAGVCIIKRENDKTDLYFVDKALKILGYVMSKKTREEVFRCGFSLVLAQKYVLDCNERYIFISHRGEGSLSKEFKNFCRAHSIPSRVRNVFFNALNRGEVTKEQLRFNI